MYQYQCVVTRVVDGDTLRVDVDLGFDVIKRTTVRLADVDTPEIFGMPKDAVEYADGMRAKRFVEDWITSSERKQPLFIKTEKSPKKGKYGRWIAHITDSDDCSLNQQLQEEGWGHEYNSVKGRAGN